MRIIIILLLISTTTFAQTSVGVMGGRSLNTDMDMFGISLNQKWDSTNISTGIAYMSPIQNFDKGSVMVNAQYHLKQFSLGGGISIKGRAQTKPFAMATFKPLKHYPIRFFFNYSETKRTLGVMFPLFIKK
ncbi:MAG: hypothetical protein CMC40_02260 [Flavobacteriaceae bacterium]|nr:hypothetical protein [Flavobacteriaceae bacterium]|tara:strand:- start:1373 stop:1765 length:393 start_codon:yes stop_codon:yes gene_type:complete